MGVFWTEVFKGVCACTHVVRVGVCFFSDVVVCLFCNLPWHWRPGGCGENLVPPRHSRREKGMETSEVNNQGHGK